MAATLRPVGHLRSYIHGEQEVIVQDNLSVRQALEGLGIPPEIVALVVVNEEQQTKEYILRDGDNVRVLAVIGGG